MKATVLCRAGALICGIAAASSLFASGDCDGVLIPTVEQANSDYSSMQSYLYVNAEKEYDRLRNIESARRGAEASYKFFSAEYNDSQTREEFREKVRSRLTKEAFSKSESEARGAYRRGLTDKQVEGWVACVTAGGGGLLLSSPNASEGAFVLRVNWIPPRSVGSADLELRIYGGMIDGKRHIQERKEGQGSQTFIVEPSERVQRIVVVGNYASIGDGLELDFARPAPVASTSTSKVNPVPCGNSMLLLACRNGGAMGNSENFCRYQRWEPGDPIKVCTPDAESPNVSTFYVCSNGGAMGTSPNFCNYMNWGPAWIVALRRADATCGRPQTFYVCENGGAMGTSPHFCGYMNWGPAKEIALCTP